MRTVSRIFLSALLVGCAGQTGITVSPPGLRFVSSAAQIVPVVEESMQALEWEARRLGEGTGLPVVYAVESNAPNGESLRVRIVRLPTGVTEVEVSPTNGVSAERMAVLRRTLAEEIKQHWQAQ
jgi:hypothetical protein